MDNIINTLSPADLRSIISSLANSTHICIEDCLVGEIKTGFECSICRVFFSRQDNFGRHAETKGCVGIPVEISYRDTICYHRFILPASTSGTIVSAAGNERLQPFPPNQLQESLVQCTCEWAMAPGPITTHTNIPIEVPNYVAVNIISTFIHKDESPTIWAPYFENLMAGGAPNFATRMQQLVRWWSVDINPQMEPELLAFMDLGNFWFQN